MGPLSRGGQSAAGGLGAPQRHHGGAGPGDEPLLLVHDLALDEPDRAAALHDAPGGRELPRPDGLQEVDLELQRGERLALGEPRRPGHTHRRVGDVAEDAAVDGAHRVRVALRRLELDDGRAGLDGPQREADQPALSAEIAASARSAASRSPYAAGTANSAASASPTTVGTRKTIPT